MTHETMQHILVVDDDGNICKTLSAILQAEGYQTTTATTAKEAIEKTKTKFFDLALLDIKLPDMEGTQLLAKLQETAPETIKIMITGYPSLKNAVESLNLGADSYTMKPINPTELLKTIKNKLEKQQQQEKITKEKLAKWVQLQARKKQSSNFEEFLEETASELAEFGLTKTQAKIYITLTALGIASASEIATLSKIRREEVYRMIPEMEKRGIITRKLEAPRKFSAIQPETSVQLLVKSKMKTIKEEIDNLGQKQVDLISKLKRIELPVKKEDCFIEAISQQDNAFAKLIDMTKNTERQIDLVAPFEFLKYAFLNCPKNLKEKLTKAIKIRVITRSYESNAFTKEIIQCSKASNNRIELRQVEKLPFNLMIVDDKEAVWGEFQAQNKNGSILWTNNPTQITILKTSFESIWQGSTS